MSEALTVLSVPSARVPSVLADLAARVGRDNVRYHLSGGAGPFGRAVWRTGPAERPASDVDLALRLLRCREEREARLLLAARAVRTWLAAANGAPRTVVVELPGPPTHDDIRFLQECRIRLDRGGLQTITVLRHAPAGAGPVVPAGGHADEILLMLRLSGGFADAANFERWRRVHGWDADLVDALTSTRDCPEGTLRVPADASLPGRARLVQATADPMLVAELAAEVVTGSDAPPLATAALVGDEAAALAAFTAGAAAEAADRGRVLSRYAGTLYRRARARGWAGVSPATAATAYLAAVVADRRRVTGSAAELVLAGAERAGVEPPARALLAFGLGQLLAKDPDPAVRAAGVRCFEHARRAHGAAVTDPGTASRLAASFNGTALVHYRERDRDGAATTMRAALDALDVPEASGDDLNDQQVLLLTNLGKLYRGDPATRADALHAYRRAWLAATTAASLSATTYVVADLVRTLAAAGEHAEADAVGEEFVRLYDRAEDPGRAAERALSTVCWRLADQRLAAGAVPDAARWYVAAVSRMRRGAPEVIDTILRNLGALSPAPDPAVVETLTRQRAAHAMTAGDLVALRGLLAEPAAAGARS
jgi:hypothetical protein